VRHDGIARGLNQREFEGTASRGDPYLGRLPGNVRLREYGVMNEVTFANVAPVISVRDLDRLSAATASLVSLPVPTRGRIGTALSNAMGWSSTSANHRNTTARVTAPRFTCMCQMPTRSMSPGRPRASKGRFIAPHDTPYGLREFAFVDRDVTAHRVGSPLAGE
jgi:hypothetical protein